VVGASVVDVHVHSEVVRLLAYIPHEGRGTANGELGGAIVGVLVEGWVLGFTERYQLNTMTFIKVTRICTIET